MRTDLKHEHVSAPQRFRATRCAPARLKQSIRITASISSLPLATGISADLEGAIAEVKAERQLTPLQWRNGRNGERTIRDDCEALNTMSSEKFSYFRRATLFWGWVL